ncbi:Antagonist of mitotic exit network 1 [Gossypium arboreum]|uniref:Antagonist of mitotic exit network 1 n=1 Tax=Gossypium arboreum TaxID=29729 RepID=A0A0B0PA97_GOSAR|nr:Antagonist of mitotic exit network 1 [Gossypium arboreum]
MKNGPKIEKMGQSTKSTRPGPPHTGRPHDCVNLEKLEHDSHGYITLIGSNTA